MLERLCYPDLMLDANGFLCKLPTINEGLVGQETATDVVATAIAIKNPMLVEVEAVFVSEILAVSRDSCGLRSPRCQPLQEHVARSAAVPSLQTAAGHHNTAP